MVWQSPSSPPSSPRTSSRTSLTRRPQLAPPFCSLASNQLFCATYNAGVRRSSQLSGYINPDVLGAAAEIPASSSSSIPCRQSAPADPARRVGVPAFAAAGRHRRKKRMDVPTERDFPQVGRVRGFFLLLFPLFVSTIRLNRMGRRR